VEPKNTVVVNGTGGTGMANVPNERGFSLIELLIVIAIIGILATISIQTYHSSVNKANEAAAVAALNTIKVAQAKFVLDHKGRYGTFPQLVSEGYLDKRFNFVRPINRGYVFTLTLIGRSQNEAASYYVNADPEESTGISSTGRVFYYIDPESGICFSTKGSATAADENL
jgi:prepilin-type N-terminal cleavage/methylation domain-containing protein